MSKKREAKNREYMRKLENLKRTFNRILDKIHTEFPTTLTVGGLHEDDFQWAVKQGEEIGMVLIAFVMSSDYYHWDAYYVKNEGQFP